MIYLLLLLMFTTLALSAPRPLNSYDPHTSTLICTTTSTSPLFTDVVNLGNVLTTQSITCYHNVDGCEKIMDSGNATISICGLPGAYDCRAALEVLTDLLEANGCAQVYDGSVHRVSGSAVLPWGTIEVGAKTGVAVSKISAASTSSASTSSSSSSSSSSSATYLPPTPASVETTPEDSSRIPAVVSAGTYVTPTTPDTTSVFSRKVLVYIGPASSTTPTETPVVAPAVSTVTESVPVTPTLSSVVVAPVIPSPVLSSPALDYPIPTPTASALYSAPTTPSPVPVISDPVLQSSAPVVATPIPIPPVISSPIPLPTTFITATPLSSSATAEAVADPSPTLIYLYPNGTFALGYKRSFIPPAVYRLFV